MAEVVRPAQFLLGQQVEAATVVQPGQLVGDRQPADLLVGVLQGGGAVAHPPFQLGVHPHVLHRDRRRVRQGLQQVDLLVGRLVPAGPVIADRADRLELADGHHHQALDEGGAVQGVRDARVAVDVGDHRRVAVEHRPAADAGPDGETAALPQRGDRVLVGVIAAVVVAEHERRAVTTGELARRGADDALQVGQGARQRQLLNGVHEPLHAVDIVGIGERRCGRLRFLLGGHAHLRAAVAYPAARC